MGKDKFVPENEEQLNDEIDTHGILFFKDERGSEQGFGNLFSDGSVMSERAKVSPLDALKNSVKKTAEEIKQSDAEKAEEKAAEEKKSEETKPVRKAKRESSLLAKCMPYIYDEEGVNYAEEKPDYTLESVEDIIESAERRADERIARMYNLKSTEVQSIGRENKESEPAPRAVLKNEATSIKKPVKIGDEVFTAAKLFETAPIPKISETLFDDLTARRTDVVGKENVITVYSEQGGMSSQESAHTRAIPDLTPETDSKDRYEDIISHTRPVNVEDISSSSTPVAKATAPVFEYEEENEPVADEFRGKDDIKRVGSKLKAEAFVARVRFLATAMLSIFAGVLLIDAIRSEFGAVTLTVIETVLLGLALIINSNIFSFFKEAFKGKSRIELPLSVAMLVSLAYYILGIILAKYPSGAVALPLVSLLVYTFCSYKSSAAVFRNFKMVASRSTKTAVTLITDPAVTTPMARSMTAGEIIAAGECRTEEIEDFIRHTRAKAALSGKANVFTLVFLIVALFIGLAVGVGSGILGGVYSAMVVLCLGSAPTLFVADIMPFVSMSDHLYRYRAAVCSAASAEKLEETNAVVIASKDIFPEGTIKLYNMTPLSANELDETLVLAAAVADNIGSPLAPVFKRILSGDITLPEADTVKYEETLGISGWVGDDHVLIGNRSLMIAHGVRVPALEVDKKMLRRGYFPVYVAVNQRACALLAVGYMVDKQVMKKLGKLQDKGVILLVDNCDPNITEQMLCDYFAFYPDILRILDFSGAHNYKKATEQKNRTSAHGFHRGDSESFIEIILSSMRLKLSKNVLSIIHLFAAIICATVFAVLTLGSAELVSAGLCLLGELISLIVALTAYFALKM